MPEASGTTAAWTWVLLNVSIVLKIVTNVWIVRISLQYLGAEQYGIWIAIQSTVGYLALCEAGIGQTVMNWTGGAYAAGDRDRVGRVVVTAFGLYLGIVLVVWGCMTVATASLPIDALILGSRPAFKPEAFALAIWVLGTLTLFRIPLFVFSGALAGLREMPVRQIQDISGQIALALVTFLVLRTGGRLLGLSVGVGVALFASSLLGYGLLVLRHPWIEVRPKQWSQPMLRPMLTNSSFFIVSSIALLIQRSAGNLLVARYASLAEVPAMFAALTLIRIVGWLVADSVSRALQPFVILFWANGEHDRVRFLAELGSKVTFAVAAVFGLLVLLFGREGFEIWLGPGMTLDGPVLGLLVLGFLIDALFLCGTNFLWVVDRHRRLTGVIGFHAALTVVLGTLGAWGFPHASLLGMTAGFALASVIGQLVPMPFVMVRGFELRFREYLSAWLLRPLTVAMGGSAVLGVAWYLGVSGLGAKMQVAMVLLVTMGLLGWRAMLVAGERAWIAQRIASLIGGRGATVDGGPR
jgi:O-antigen/teichoic acid export membrane protein